MYANQILATTHICWKGVEGRFRGQSQPKCQPLQKSSFYSYLLLVLRHFTIPTLMRTESCQTQNKKRELQEIFALKSWTLGRLVKSPSRYYWHFWDIQNQIICIQMAWFVVKSAIVKKINQWILQGWSLMAVWRCLRDCDDWSHGKFSEFWGW